MGGKRFQRHHAVRLDVALVCQMFADDAVKIRDDHVAMVVFGGADQQLGGIRRDPVVTIQKLQVLARRVADGDVAGVGNTGVFLVDDTDACVLFCIFVANLRGSVLASVVDQD